MRYAILLVVAFTVGCTGTIPTPEPREPEPVHDGKTLSEWLEQMRDRDTTRNGQAAEALAKMGKPAVSALIEVLEDKNAGVSVRQRAASALGDMGSDAKPAVPALTRILKDGAEDSLLSDTSAKALAGIERPDYSTLIRCLKDKRDACRGKASIALMVEAHTGQDIKAAVPALIEALGDESWYLRENASMALRAIGPAAKQAVPALVAALKDEYEGVRQAAAGALGEIRASDKEVVSALMLTVLKDKKYDVWKAASSSLAKIGRPAVPALVEALKDKDACARLRALITLQEMGPIAKPAVPTLLIALKDKDEHVRVHTREALQKIDPDAAKNAGFE